MANLRDIYSSMNNFQNASGGHRRLQDYPDILIYDVLVSPTKSSHILKFTGVAESQSKPSRYNVAVSFFNQNFSDKKSPAFPNEIKYRGKTFFIPIPTELDSIAVSCGCMDFKMRFANPLFNRGSLIGQPIKYIRKPGSTRPSVNPNHTMGLCKHLWAFLKALDDSSLVNIR